MNSKALLLVLVIVGLLLGALVMRQGDLAWMTLPFLAMRAAVEEVYVDADVQRYIVSMVTASRQHHQVMVGASPRGSLALLKLSRAWAAIQGRAFVVPDDVKSFVRLALAHRLVLDPNLWGSKKAELSVIDQVAGSVRVPVLKGAHD